MIRTLTKNWWLLVVCGVLYAMSSGVYLMMQAETGRFDVPSWHASIVFLGDLALTAAACTIAASLWTSAGARCWLLTVNGVVLAALGLIEYGLTGFRIKFLTIALLIVLMALSMGFLELRIARALRREGHLVTGWSSTLAGVASVGFALTFLDLGSGWNKIQPGSHSDLLWLGSYFGFTAVCLLALAVVLHSLRRSQSAWWGQAAVGK